jgi:hypothetical protein
VVGIYKLLENIKKRPKMYIGSLSITKLHMLLMGYSMAKMEVSLNKTIEESAELREFQDWIQEKYDILDSKSWANIILENSTGEEEAFNNFFELFDEFRNQINKR